MADVELVIKIPEELKEAIDNSKAESALKYIQISYSIIYKAIKNGTPLPKGHGRLIDADAVLEDPIGNTHKDIDIAETIIEAEREEKNNE